MGKLLFILILGVGGIYAYEHYYGRKPSPPRLATEGLVYNLVRTNATSDGVLVGIRPGSELSLIGKTNGAATVEYRGIRFTMPETSLTRDLDAVDQIRADAARRPPQSRENPPSSAPMGSPPTDPEVEKLTRSLNEISDKKADFEHQLARVRLLRSQKGDFNGLTDLRVAADELTTKIRRLELDAQRIKQLIERKSR